jgi:hypothetical protein
VALAFSNLISFELEREIDFADTWLDENRTRLNKTVTNRILKEFIEDVAERAKQSMTFWVPEQSGDMMKHIDINMPNVRGGVWDWEASVGIRPIVGADDPNYPLYVLRGTGIFKGRGVEGGGGTFGPGNATFGPSGNFPALPSQTRQGVIKPANGNVMSFLKPDSGERVVTRFVRGQQAEDFLSPVAEDVNDYIRDHRPALVAKLKTVMK